jgi:hypothetical protein
MAATWVFASFCSRSEQGIISFATNALRLPLEAFGARFVAP